MVKKKITPLKIICERCKQETNHELLKEIKEREESLDGDIIVIENRQIIRCKGCGKLSFRKLSACSEDTWLDNNGNLHDEVISEMFPKRAFNTIQAKSFGYTPNILRKIYKEVITAYNENCYLLTVIGIRALLEGICKEEKIKGKDLSQKIISLVDNGIITKKISEVLHDIRKLGNEVTHELEELDGFEITRMIEIIENILENIYELPNKTKVVIANKEIRKMNEK